MCPKSSKRKNEPTEKCPKSLKKPGAVRPGLKNTQIKAAFLLTAFLSWRGRLHSFRPGGQNMPYHDYFSLSTELTFKVSQGDMKSKYPK